MDYVCDFENGGFKGCLCAYLSWFLGRKNDRSKTKASLEKCHSDFVPLRQMVANWFADFKRGLTNTDNVTPMVTPENIKRILKSFWQTISKVAEDKSHLKNIIGKSWFRSS